MNYIILGMIMDSDVTVTAMDDKVIIDIRNKPMRTVFFHSEENKTPKIEVGKTSFLLDQSGKCYLMNVIKVIEFVVDSDTIVTLRMQVEFSGQPDLAKTTKSTKFMPFPKDIFTNRMNPSTIGLLYSYMSDDDIAEFKATNSSITFGKNTEELHLHYHVTMKPNDGDYIGELFIYGTTELPSTQVATQIATDCLHRYKPGFETGKKG